MRSTQFSQILFKSERVTMEKLKLKSIDSFKTKKKTRKLWGKDTEYV